MSLIYTFATASDKGYSAALGQYYIGYKLHLLISLNGVYQRMELTKASVHDSKYLKTIKNSGIKNSLLLGDRGYLSDYHQTDLFESCGIELQNARCVATKKTFDDGPKYLKMHASESKLFSLSYATK